MQDFNPEKFLVLVVDDIKENIQLIVEMLEKYGYATTFARNGPEALQRVASAKPDLILLDLMMPKMDGLEVCEQLKANSVHREIPIIFLTASHEREQLLKAFDLGAADYITKPFNAAELLARVRTHLEFKQTRDRLLEALEEAEEATRVKSQFLATMSHEIRTPMNAVLGMTELMLNTELNSQQLDFLQTLKVSGENLLAIINDILDFSKLEAGEVRLEKRDFDLNNLLKDIVYLFTSQSQAKGIKLSCTLASDVPRNITSDEYRLRQILANLVSNGIKFTEKGEVSIRVEVRAGEKIYFAVKDTGIGIAPEGQEQLFQSFSQLDLSTTRKYGGTGLGLAICKQLVRLLGGEIGVESTRGYGSTFWFTISSSGNLKESNFREEVVFAIEEKPKERVEIRNGNKQDLKILLVEDTPINQKVILNQLELLGYKADWVNNGQEALERLTESKYDIILMDCQMPVLDGYRATEMLRQQEGKEMHTVVIGLTAYAMKGDREKCLAAGMDDYLSKPVSMTDFSATIAKWSPLKDEITFAEENEVKEIGITKSIATKLRSPLDRNRLARISGGDRNFESELLAFFVGEAKNYLIRSREAIAKGDCSTLANLAHQIKGSSANLGLRLMPEIAARLESQALENNLEQASGFVSELEQILERVQAFV